MNAERLLVHYERIADAPDAIARLRRFILDLAVRGKLVPQNASDEPASELLKRIAAEKAQLVKEGKAKHQDALPEIDPGQSPFELPAGWAWGRFPELGTFGRGKSKHRPRNDPALFAGGEHLMIQTGDVARSRGFIETYTGKYNDFGLSQSVKWPKGTLCITIAANIADSGILCFEACFPDSVVGFVPMSMFDNARYFEYFVRTAKANLLEFAPATAQKNINLEILTQVLIPLPPLAEQHRIVAKVDELMTLCDRLEAARAERETTRDRLTAASLARLNAPDPDPATFAGHARFALDSLAALTTRSDQIKQLRQTILNLAVHGKLVPQDPKDEPASELLERMVRERKATVATRKIRGATPPKPPSAKAEGFDLPTSWELCALGQITLITDPNPSHRYPDYSGGTVPILSTREFAGDNGWNPETAKLTTRAFWEFQKEICQFAEGDIIFARKGRLGLPRFLPPFEKFTFSHTLFSIKPMTGLNPAYVLWLLRRKEVVDWLTNEMNQNTGVPTLGKAKTDRLPVPLPPLAEQHRIVAKVDALMALCDRLEASLTTATATRRRLLDALLAEALSPVVARPLAAE